MRILLASVIVLLAAASLSPAADPWRITITIDRERPPPTVQYVDRPVFIPVPVPVPMPMRERDRFDINIRDRVTSAPAPQSRATTAGRDYSELIRACINNVGNGGNGGNGCTQPRACATGLGSCSSYGAYLGSSRPAVREFQSQPAPGASWGRPAVCESRCGPGG